MKNIKEVEKLVGISSQNIRYYEKVDLIKPIRNDENDYREYSDQDIEVLKLIKLLRKLDMPISLIKQVLHQQISMREALIKQKEYLKNEKNRLEDALIFCNHIKETSIETINVDLYLNEMEKAESKGAIFKDFVDDFKKVSKAEKIREFSFMPDTMCLNKKEMTDALFAYANEHHLNLVITKESMYPEFTIDDIEYQASRTFSHFGAVVTCTMKDENSIIPKGMSTKRYHFIRRLISVLTPLALVVFIILTRVSSWQELVEVLPIALVLGIVSILTYGFNFPKD
ncbi:MAG: MerR family transcriptional regulator [Beduini sp.]